MGPAHIDIYILEVFGQYRQFILERIAHMKYVKCHIRILEE